MRKLIQSTESIVVNENGEVLTSRANRTVSWGSEPPFIKLYLDSLLYLKDLPKAHTTTLMEFLKRMTYAGDEEGQVIYTNSTMKKTIATAIGVTVPHIDNVLSDLTKGEIFYRIGRGTYRVNPNFFGKGEWQDISRLRLEITFDANGKTIMGEVQRKKKVEVQCEGQQSLDFEVVKNGSAKTA